MSLQYSIPKTARFLQTRNVFTAAFNFPTLGLYDLAVAGNTGQIIIPINANSVYLINRVSIGGNLPQEEYLNNIVTLPLFTLRYAIERRPIYAYPIPIVQFFDNLEAVAWFFSDKRGDQLIADLNVGQFSQSAFLVGKPSISINITLSIFEIAESGFVRSFRDSNEYTDVGMRTNLPGQGKILAR